MIAKPFRGSLGIPVVLQCLGSTKNCTQSRYMEDCFSQAGHRSLTGQHVHLASFEKRRHNLVREEHVVIVDFLDAAMGILIYLSRASMG